MTMAPLGPISRAIFAKLFSTCCIRLPSHTGTPRTKTYSDFPGTTGRLARVEILYPMSRASVLCQGAERCIRDFQSACPRGHLYGTCSISSQHPGAVPACAGADPCRLQVSGSTLSLLIPPARQIRDYGRPRIPTVLSYLNRDFRFACPGWPPQFTQRQRSTRNSCSSQHRPASGCQTGKE